MGNRKRKRYLASPLQGEERGSSSLWFWSSGILPRLLISVHLSRVVLHQGSSPEEGADDLIGGLVFLASADEVDTQTADIAGDGEVIRLVCAYGLQTDFESAEAIELHGAGVLELVGHHLDKFIDYREHVGLLDGTVTLDDVCQSIGIDHLELHCTTVIEVT